MRLQQKLRQCGVELDAEELRDEILTLFTQQYPAWVNDPDNLLHRPLLALDFVERVRRRVNALVPHEVVLAVLSNERKAGRLGEAN